MLRLQHICPITGVLAQHAEVRIFRIFILDSFFSSFHKQV